MRLFVIALVISTLSTMLLSLPVLASDKVQADQKANQTTSTNKQIKPLDTFSAVTFCFVNTYENTDQEITRTSAFERPELNIVSVEDLEDITIEQGTTLTFEAFAASWEFEGWAGDLTGTDTSVDLLMDSDKDVTATFEEMSDLAIGSVEDLDDITVAYGTALDDLPLPSTVAVDLDDGSSTNLGVTWDGGTPPYNGDEAGIYAFKGTLTLLNGILNPDRLTAEVDVIVEEASENTYSVSFYVEGIGGSLIATVEGTQIDSGDNVNEGSNVFFEALPDEGYQVLEWTLNGDAIEDHTELTYTYEHLDQEITVETLFAPLIHYGEDSDEDTILCQYVWESFWIEVDEQSFDEINWEITEGDASLMRTYCPRKVWIQVGEYGFKINVSLTIDDNQVSGSKSVEVCQTPPPQEAMIVKKSENILLVDQSENMEVYESYEWGKFDILNLKRTINGDKQFQYFDDGVQSDKFYYYVITTTEDNDCVRWSFYNGPETNFPPDIVTNINFNIYPNPVNSGESLTLSWNHISSHDIQIYITDLSGQTVFLKYLTNTEHHDALQIPPGNHPPGLYIISLHLDGQILHQKLIIQ